MSTNHKPLCPCCFQAYSSSLMEKGGGEASNKDATTLFCGTCAPSDIERALAKKAETKDGTTVPPIVWNLTVEEIQAGTKQVLEATKANLDDIASLSSNLTFENTIAKLMTPPNYKTNPQVAACKFLQHCHTDPTIREAASQAGKEFSKSRVQGRMRKDVYERVKAFSEQEEELTDYQQHFLTACLNDFERAGLALSTEDAAKLQDLLEQDSAICSEYGTNLGSDNTELYFTPEQLEGCSKEDFIQPRLVQPPEGKDKCKITLKYPDIIPIGQNCSVAETRRLVTEAREGSNNAFYSQNLDLVAKGIQLRKQIATLLGYPSWAEYICSQRMSGSYQAVNDFLANLQEKLQTAGKQDYNTLLELKKKDINTEDDEDDVVLNAWDTSYYNNLLLKTKYGVDAEAIKEYFPLDHVVETTLAIYQELLGLTFLELEKGTYWSWHAQVRCFQVTDTASNERIGHFYLDLHPRPGTTNYMCIG